MTGPLGVDPAMLPAMPPGMTPELMAWMAQAIATAVEATTPKKRGRPRKEPKQNTPKRPRSSEADEDQDEQEEDDMKSDPVEEPGEFESDVFNEKRLLYIQRRFKFHKSKSELFADVTREMNKRFVFVSGEDKVSIVDLNGQDPYGKPTMLIRNLENTKEVCRPLTILYGKKEDNAVNIWSKSQQVRKARAIVFDPKMETTGNMNLFTGLEIDKDKAVAGDCSPVINHIRTVLAHGKDECFQYIIKFFAHLIQKVAVKMGVAMAFIGAQGAGKGIIIEMFKKILGVKYFYKAQSFTDIDGNFQPDELRTNLLIFFDECEQMKQYAGKRKGDVTSDTRNFNKKFEIQRVLPNYSNFVYAANEQPCVIEETNRKFATFEVDAKWALADPKEKKAYFAKIGAVDPRHFAHYLYHLDLTGFDPEDIPSTRYSREQKWDGMTVLMKWLDHWLSHPENDVAGIKKSSDVYKLFRDYCDENNIEKKDCMPQKRFEARLPKVIPELQEKKRTGRGDKRVQGWHFPSLTICRGHFQKAIKEPDWNWDHPIEDDHKTETPTATASPLAVMTTVVTTTADAPHATVPTTTVVTTAVSTIDVSLVPPVPNTTTAVTTDVSTPKVPFRWSLQPT